MVAGNHLAMKRVKKILITTDFSELSLAAIDYASTFELREEVEFSLIHVVDHVYNVQQQKIAHKSERAIRAGEVKASERLKQFVLDHVKLRGNINQIVKTGKAYAEIVRIAKDDEMDFIIIATHGRTGLAHVFLGSVAEKVVRYSTVPVLTVKPEAMQELLISEKDIEEQLHII